MQLPDNLITLENVSIRYKLLKAMNGSKFYEPLSDISFEIRKGETLGVIGRNGAGKSTLLRILAGVYAPDKGEIKRAANLKVSLLSLHAGFDQKLTGYDNIIFSCLLLGFSRKECLDKIDEIISMSELEGFIHQPIKTYSSGMKSKLGFSIAFQMSPDILLIDEALSVGDAKFKKKAEKLMIEKIKGGQTAVFVSHSSSQIKRICTRVIWIEDGMVKKTGDAESIIKEYDNE
ncbi:lipopolysaccharide transport system ATP-binding protein [Sinobacterium caligoides]|uniref:Lipopolysaccharide transport system ATP-binding protein n=2 Tax=Sinobacterium caligoides TaxID=933926 RepID=A0A3N2DPX4_9GAMM|nr:ABC transporter ATP-binding protein [Sinobacterium caligoides]ROS01847.1 lipopolysaccharide transport system ATP-binding protein [Sinobacterium caligoides]